MPDPWLTDEGDVHPALKVAGMPEWVEAGNHYRFVFVKEGRPQWVIEYGSLSGEYWLPRHEASPHEAAAIIEKDQLEKLIAKHAVDGATLTIDHEGAEGYCYITVAGSDGTTRTLAEEATYPEALQAAALAAKERE